MQGIDACAGRLGLLATLAVVSLVLLGGPAAPVSAQNSVIRAQVCNGDTSPSVVFSNLDSDMMVQSRELPINGSARNTSQLEVSIEGTYVRTVAVASGNTDFETSISLAPGTHTISIDAEPICPGDPTKYTFVITYRPPPQPVVSPRPPSAGAETPTISNPNVISPGGVVVSPPSTEKFQESIDETQKERSWLTGWVGRWLASILGESNQADRQWRLIPRSADGAGGGVIGGWLIIMVLGLVAVIGGWRVAGFAKKVRLAGTPTKRAINLGVRTAGAVLVVVGFVGLQ